MVLEEYRSSAISEIPEPRVGKAKSRNKQLRYQIQKYATARRYNFQFEPDSGLAGVGGTSRIGIRQVPEASGQSNGQIVAL
jgi:hypothetical protein